MKGRLTSAMLAIAACLAQTARAQAPESARPAGWELSGLPALNFNADEGFGYGVNVQAFNYGNGSERPYRYTLQPQVFFTTKGRRNVNVFFDAPHLLPRNWRISSYLGREQQLSTPYYGLGNNTRRDERLEEPPNPHFYRFGRVGVRISTDLQHSLRGPLRVLVGASARTWKIDDTPFDSGSTLLALEGVQDTAVAKARTISVRMGLVYDTRDREIGPTKGQWIEALVQRAGEQLGGTHAFTRVTATARVYIPLSRRLVWAQRITAQRASNSTPFYERFTIQGSFKETEGLGGANTVRGLPMNRYVGNGIAFVNEEFRWIAKEFSLRKRASALVLSGFTDIGRVWDNTVSQTASDGGLHLGFGAGARLRYGQDFLIALDVGHSKESTAPIYIGLGYLF